FGKNGEDRYQTVAGLERDLRRWLTEWVAQRRIDDLPQGEHETSIRLLISKRLVEAVRELETELAHMNRVSMVGELAASLFHEITQLIASARNNARAAPEFSGRAAAGPARSQGGARLRCKRCGPGRRYRRPHPWSYQESPTAKGAA